MTTKDTSKHANKATWQKGKSGNPGGRSPRVGPNGETLAELARGKTVEMLNIMVTLAQSAVDEELRFKAADSILSRGWGKPTENVKMDADVKGAGVPIIQIVRRADDDSES